MAERVLKTVQRERLDTAVFLCILLVLFLFDFPLFGAHLPGCAFFRDTNLIQKIMKGSSADGRKPHKMGVFSSLQPCRNISNQFRSLALIVKKALKMGLFSCRDTRMIQIYSCISSSFATNASSVSLNRCAYTFNVMFTSECPRRLDTATIFTPLLINNVACECLKSCNTMGCTPLLSIALVNSL